MRAGKGFDALLERPDPELVQPMLRRGTVFARMSPGGCCWRGVGGLTFIGLGRSARGGWAALF